VTSAGYLRFPHLHNDLIAFIAEDDVWLGPAAGGRAWRVSADQAQASHPRISRDGTMIAWTSRRDGPPEVYLAGVDGGNERRLTYWGDAQTRVCGWTPDGAVLATTASGQPFGHFTWAYAVPAGAPDGHPVAGAADDHAAGAAGAADEQAAGAAGAAVEHAAAAGGGGDAAAGAAVLGPAGTRRLPFGPVGELAIEPGAVALLTGNGGRDPATWKRYRGGTAGRLWLASAASGGTGAGPFTRILGGLTSQFANPMLIDGRLAFLSDHEGTGNLYSCALDGGDLRRHTDHDGFYARNASSDGSRVVYHCAGDIWLLESLDATAEARLLEISLGSPAAKRARRLITAEDHLGTLSCDHTGQASAVEVRGTVHWMTHRDGPARALSVVPGVRASQPQVLGTTGQVVWVTDADGADALEIASADGTSATAAHRRVAAGSIGRVEDIAAAPDGSAVAVAARDGRLHVVDVASGAVAEIASSDNGAVTGLAWSTDSAWLAWSHPGPAPLRRLRMAQLAGQVVLDVTDGRFVDTDPVFTTDGRYLAFLSRRSFDPVYDAHFFDLSFPYGSRPYLMPLAADTPSPFGPLRDGRPVGGGQPKDDAAAHAAGKDDAGSGSPEEGRPDAGSPGDGTPGKASPEDGTPEDGTPGDGTPGKASPEDGSARPQDDGEARVAPVDVDTEHLPGRIVQVPVPESRYSSLRAVKGGLAWLREPVTGELGEGGANHGDAAPRPALERFDFVQQRSTELDDEVDWFEVSGDGCYLVVSDHGDLSVVPADRKPDSDNPADHVSVDLSRARYLAEPAALWRNAYEEAGRFIRHDFWVPDLAEVDWDGVLAAYRPLLDRIAGPGDFADLLWEVLGELGTSHAYVAPAGRGRNGRPKSVGLLGADLELAEDGSWRVTRVIPGESSDPRACSPLAAPGAGIDPGDALLAVDGQRVGAPGPGPLLAGAAGKPVELTIGPAGGGHPRRAVVSTLKDDRRLRYQDWVASRRQRVRELSRGRIGYLHVPDMVSEGWADFHRDLRGEMVRDALIVDARGNRGGHTSQLVVEKLARRVIGWDVPRGMQPSTYPLDAPRGPVVAIADEFSGSDGDIVTAAIKILRLGPVVGTRTWGGVIGIDVPFHELVDGTEITVPRYATWMDGYGWGVENHGVDPDVEVIPSPDDYAAGLDQQLETAVRLALEALEARPPVTAPDKSDRPSRRRPALPPRPSAGHNAGA
jgi:tricorn protease